LGKPVRQASVLACEDSMCRLIGGRKRKKATKERGGTNAIDMRMEAL